MTFRQLHLPCPKVQQRDQKNKNKKCKCYNHINHNQSKQSIKLNKSFEQIEDITDRLFSEAQRMKNKKMKQLEKSIKMKQQKQISECTFKPNIVLNPQYFVSKSSFLERQMNWSQSKIRKLKVQKDKKSNLEVSGCNFTPKINKNSSKIIQKMKTEEKVVDTTNKKKIEQTKNNSYMNKYLRNQMNKKVSIQKIEEKQMNINTSQQNNPKKQQNQIVINIQKIYEDLDKIEKEIKENQIQEIAQKVNSEDRDTQIMNNDLDNEDKE